MNRYHNIIFSLLLCSMTACKSNGQSPTAVTIEDDNGKAVTYTELLPESGTIRGVVVLLAGFSQRGEDVFSDSDLPMIAHQHDLLVVGVSPGFNMTANNEKTAELTSILTDVLIRHEMDQQPFVFGGFSAGGTIALRYAERCHESPGDFPVVPSAVFAVDAPVDIIAFWSYTERELARNYSEVGMNEAKAVSKMLENKYGTLAEHRSVYEEITPIDVSSFDVGNEQYLVNIPVRTYHDVDINWQLRERRRSAYDANFLNSSELISRLLLQGNTRAEFIQSPIKGQRRDGRMHPHSWNIVDGEECVEWMKKAMWLDQPAK